MLPQIACGDPVERAAAASHPIEDGVGRQRMLRVDAFEPRSKGGSIGVMPSAGVGGRMTALEFRRERVGLGGERVELMETSDVPRVGGERCPETNRRSVDRFARGGEQGLHDTRVSLRRAAAAANRGAFAARSRPSRVISTSLASLPPSGPRHTRHASH